MPACDDITIAVKATFAPTADGFRDELTAVVVADLVVEFTVCVIAGDVLVAYEESPEYVAVIVWPPVLRALVEYCAAPEPSVTGEPSAAEPSKNCTVPVIVPLVEEVTAAVNVTLAPAVDGFTDEVTTVVVEAFEPALIVCVIAGDVLVAYAESPEYVAVMVCEPCESVVVEYAALPPAKVTGDPIAFAPS